MKLKQKTAIVTGAATGIGFAIAQKVAAEGGNVVLADIKGHDEAAERLRLQGANAIGFTADVTSPQAVDALVAATIDRFGAVDILVNNAAISAGLRPGPFEQFPVEEWRRMFEVNTIGVFICCRAVSAHMRARKQGRIINITSGTAFKGAPGLMHYVASKGAVMAMTRSLANEFGADNVLVNAVSPGYTMTEGNVTNPHFTTAMNEYAIATRALKREATAMDVANAVYFFMTDESAFITGQILAADGGSVFH